MGMFIAKFRKLRSHLITFLSMETNHHSQGCYLAMKNCFIFTRALANEDGAHRAIFTFNLMFYFLRTIDISLQYTMKGRACEKESFIHSQSICR